MMLLTNSGFSPTLIFKQVQNWVLVTGKPYPNNAENWERACQLYIQKTAHLN